MNRITASRAIPQRASAPTPAPAVAQFARRQPPASPAALRAPQPAASEPRYGDPWLDTFEFRFEW